MNKRAFINPLWIIYGIIVIVLIMGLAWLFKKFYDFMNEFITVTFPTAFEFLWKGLILLGIIILAGYLFELAILGMKKLWEHFWD